MRTFLTLIAALALVLPASTRAEEAKSGSVAAPPLPDFKFDTGAAKADPASAPAPAKPEKPARPALDVSRMPFDNMSIKEVVKHHMPEIQECYEKVLADTGQKLQGRVVVGFIIDTNGVVSEARVLAKKSTLKDDRVHDCVLAMRSWSFPKPGDNRDHPIEYPFDLKIKQ